MRCVSCGATLPDGAKFCRACGTISASQAGASGERERGSTPGASATTFFDPVNASPGTQYGASYADARPRHPHEQFSAYGTTSPPILPPTPQRRSGLFMIILLVLLILVSGVVFELFRVYSPQKVFFLSDAAQPVATIHVTHPPTSLVTPTPGSGTLLYQADWSQGLGGWTGATGWKTSGGMLVNDGKDAPSGPAGPTILAPYQLSAAGNFAIEARIQVVGAGCFDPLLFHGSVVNGNWQGYKLTACGNLRLTSDDFTDILGQTTFNPGNSWHIYRVEVKGAFMSVLVDGITQFTTQDSRYLSGSQVGIKTSVQLIVSNFKITAL